MVSSMSSWDDDERAALLALLRARPESMTWSRITSEVVDAGSARAVWERFGVPSLFDADAEVFHDTEPEIESAKEDIAAWRSAEFDFITFRDDEYPQQLREVNQFPPFVFVRGTRVPRENAVSVVGSRKASPAAWDTAVDISARLVEAGFTVLSGLASGIDTAAHNTALENGGRTVAVIGNGIRRVYPAANRELQERIAREGMVLSQFWPDSPPAKHTFPMRNATMSAYGIATIVVEAGEHSGARIQARTAVEHGRPVILLDPVVRGTAWGASLRGQPGVFVVDSPRSAVSAVEQIVSGKQQVERLLAAPVS
ncbi:DNA processing protein [Actinopolyspora lacussalsi subsp. righensis]|uniref:DNA processing protein n=2 Tax=Actinopolyspora righensis TaxID=995060 RepID=A0A1I7C0E5_9ACTN|nr:DNA processing protein [Actinopolyspora righensis]